jgi:NitT/TauT family transport system substrate-binding protein
MRSSGLRAAVCGSLMVAGVLLAGADAWATENVTLITDFGFNGRHAYFYVALDKGYY